MKINVANILIGIVSVLIIASLSLFVVDQRQTAIVFQLGEMVSVKTEPGLYFQVPLMQNVRFFDSRILTLDTGEPEPFHHCRKEKRDGGFLRQVAHRGREAILHQRRRR